MLNKPPSKTLNSTQGAEDARRALALQPSEPRLHSLTLARPALAEHSSLHKAPSPLSSRAGHLSLPPVGVELPWAASPHKGKRSLERSVARAIGSGCFCCCFSSFCLTVGLCSRPARHIALQSNPLTASKCLSFVPREIRDLRQRAGRSTAHLFKTDKSSTGMMCQCGWKESEFSQAVVTRRPKASLIDTGTLSMRVWRAHVKRLLSPNYS